jgi:RND family efflux transporter MFP subunit
MKTISKLLIISILIFTVSCGEEKTETKDNRPTVSVKVSSPSALEGNFLNASGKVEAIQNANLSTRIMGFVNKVHVKVGDKVRKGQLLLSINSADINAQKAQVNASITEATAAYKNAEKDYNRFKALFEDSSASQKEMDDMTTHYKMAKAQLKTAMEMEKELNETLKYATIRAPYNGIITKKFVNIGDMAAPGMPLVGIEQSKGFNVSARVPENEISWMQLGDEVNVKVNAANAQVKGEIIEVNSSALLTGSQYEVKISLDPTAEQMTKLRSGMYANVLIEKGGEKTIMVPENAIVYRGQLSGIYTISQSNTAMLRWIRLGKQKGNMVEVISGLKAGESYVSSCDGKMCDGASVNILK